MKKLDKTVTLAILDEDNSQRVIFRIFPLCTKDGLIFINRKQSYPDFGSLRVIPDKREQSSFKERMRGIGRLCCVQLLDDGKELTKIRQNRNYDPNQGEYNQFAIYSDVICGFDHDAIFEVYQEEQPFSQALTENVLLQRGKILFGPVGRDAALDWNAMKPFGNENFLMHTVEDADGNQRIYYWNPDALVSWRQRKREMKKGAVPKSQPEEALIETSRKRTQPPATEIKTLDEPLPIGTKLEILNEDLNHLEQIIELDRPVSSDANRLAETPLPEPQPFHETPKFQGTPIFDALKSSRLNHSGNGFMHGVVEKQIKEKQSNGHPVQPDRRPVGNPLERLQESFNYVWDSPTLRNEFLRLLGENKEITRAILESQFNAESPKASYNAVKPELDDIEGERLALLVELDKVKENYQQIKDKMYSELAKQKQDQLEAIDRRLKELAREKQDAEETLSELGESIRKGTLELLSKKIAMDVQSNGSDIVLSPTIGTDVEARALVETVRSAMSDIGFMCKQDCVTELMIFLSLHDQICFTANTLGEAALYVKNVLRALGLLNVSAWPGNFGNLRIVSLLPETAQRTLTVEVIVNDRAPIRAYGHKTIRLLDPNNLAAAGSLPVLWAPVFNQKRSQVNLQQCGKPISLRSIHAFAEHADPLFMNGEEWLNSYEEKLKEHNLMVSDEIIIAARKFVRIAAPQLIGGLVEAVDTAALVWLVPKLITGKFPKERLPELIGDLPKCTQVMAEANY
jgi:hypothetical protein